MRRSGTVAAFAPMLLLLATACTTVDGEIAQAAAPALALKTSNLALTSPDGRSIDVAVVAPSEPRGIILFSHGAGSSPAATAALSERLARLGFAVLAPTHTDSLSLAAERRTDFQTAFGTRIADMLVTSGYAANAYAGLPVAQVGYSYGSLTSLIGGGAFAGMMPGANPATKAVIMFSSPGPIEPLTSVPGAFAAVKVPSLLITGDADTVPGFVSDPAQHLLYFDRLPEGDRTALVVKGASHEFVRGQESGWDVVSGLVEDYLLARVLGDASAAARFDKAASSDRVSIRRR